MHPLDPPGRAADSVPASWGGTMTPPSGPGAGHRSRAATALPACVLLALLALVGVASAQPPKGERPPSSTDLAAGDGLAGAARFGFGALLFGLGALGAVLAGRAVRWVHPAPPPLEPPPRDEPPAGRAVPSGQAALLAVLQTALEQNEATGGMAALLLIDLRGLAAMGEHASGNRAAIRRLQGVTRGSDHLVALDPHLLALVQVGLRDPSGAERLAGRLATRLREPERLGDPPPAPGIGVRIGIAVTPGDGATPLLLLRAAESALAEARLAGTMAGSARDPAGAIRRFSPSMASGLAARQRLERDLRDAAACPDESFRLLFQPLHALPGRQLQGFEALLRWTHRELGTVSPTEFIPVAEETGLILPIGAWVLRTACREAARWPAPFYLAVNLSPAQFRDGDLPELVDAALAQSGLDPHRLELEITEGMMLQDSAPVRRQLEALRARGVRIVMDDFGSGWSNLGNLRRYPFDKLKIDRSFIRDLGEDARADAIVQTIVDLGRALGIPVVAEGIETEAQLRAVAAAGCDEVQGFLLGRPAPLDAIALAREGTPDAHPLAQGAPTERELAPLRG